MARLIQFYVPKNFKAPKLRWLRWLPLERRGKVLQFKSAAMKKSA